ncbi:MAG: tetratricopeptide repeat protein [Cyclobacteriaceae bacterium]
MVNYIFLIVLFLLLPLSNVLSQDLYQEVDSLNKKIERLLKTDKEDAFLLADSLLRASAKSEWWFGIINAKHSLGHFHRLSGDYDLARSTIRENQNLIELHASEVPEYYQTTIQTILGVSYYHLAILDYYQGHYDMSVANTLKADSTYDLYLSNEPEKLTIYKNNLSTSAMLRGAVLYTQGKLDAAIPVFEQAILISHETGSEYNRVVSLINLGLLYKDKGDLKKSIEHQQEALNISQELNYSTLEANIQSSIGQVFYVMRDYERALGYGLRAYRNHQQADVKPGMAEVAANIGDNYKKLGHIDSARWYYDHSLALHRDMDQLDNQAYLLERIGGLLVETHQYDEALAFIDEGLDIVSDQSIPEEELLLTVAKAETQLGLGWDAQALITANKALQLAENTENIGFKKDVFGVAYSAYKANGLFEKALEFADNFSMLKDSLYTEEKAIDVARVEYRLALEEEKKLLEAEQNRQMLLVEQERERERLILYAALVGAVLLLIIAVILLRSYTIKKKSNALLAETNATLKKVSAKEAAALKEALLSKERELATLAMASHEKNKLLDSLEKTVTTFASRMDMDMKSSFQQMQKTINEGKNLDKSWDSFLHRFEDVYPGFFDGMKQNNPDLTVNELKLAAYIKIGMSNQEIANVSFLALGTVKSNINRLKKKLSLGPKDKIRDYLLAI